MTAMALVVMGAVSLVAAPGSLAAGESMQISSSAPSTAVSGSASTTITAGLTSYYFEVDFPNANFTTVSSFSGDPSYCPFLTLKVNGAVIPITYCEGGPTVTGPAGHYFSASNTVLTPTIGDVFVLSWDSTAVSTTASGVFGAVVYDESTSSLVPVIATISGSGSSGSPSPATPATPAAPAAPPLPAPESLPPVPGIAPAAEIPAGGSLGSVNGVPVTTTVTVNPAGGVQVAGGGATVALADLDPDGNPLPASGGGLSGAPGGGLSVRASGFLPQSQADVYMYSEQLWLGKATVDAGGNVAMSLTIPSWVTPGAHTLQFVGYQGPYTSIALSTGITVAAPAAASAAVQPVSGETTGYFRRGAIALAYAAKARLWNAVNAPAQGSAGANVACTVTHAQPGTPADQALWARRNAGTAGFLTRAGCDTIIARLGDLAGVTGAVGLAVRVTATAA